MAVSQNASVEGTQILDYIFVADKFLDGRIIGHIL